MADEITTNIIPAAGMQPMQSNAPGMPGGLAPVQNDATSMDQVMADIAPMDPARFAQVLSQSSAASQSEQNTPQGAISMARREAMGHFYGDYVPVVVPQDVRGNEIQDTVDPGMIPGGAIASNPAVAMDRFAQQADREVRGQYVDRYGMAFSGKRIEDYGDEDRARAQAMVEERSGALRNYASERDRADAAEYQSDVSSGRLAANEAAEAAAIAGPETAIATPLGFGASWRANMAGKNGFMGAALALQTASSIEQAWEPALAARAYLPEQAEQQTESSLLPLAGAAIGAFAGQLGAMVGGGVGMAAQGAWNTFAEGHEFAPERAAIETGLGSVTGTVQEFQKALQGANGNLADLSNVVSSWGRSGQVGVGGIAAMGDISAGLGVAFTGDMADVSHLLSSTPFAAELQRRLGVSGGTRGDWADTAALGVVSGDYAGMRGAQAAEEQVGKPPTLEAQARERHRRLHPEDPEWAVDMDAGIDAWYKKKFEGGVDPSAPPMPAALMAKEKTQQDDLYAIQKAQTEIISGQSELGTAQSSLQIALAHGGGAAVMAGAVGGFQSASADITSGANAAISALKIELSGTSDPGIQRDIRQKILDYETLLNQSQVATAQLERTQSQTEVGEALAGYGMGISEAGLGVATSLYGGGSIDDITGAMGKRISRERESAAYEINAGQTQPYLTPTERRQHVATGYQEQAAAEQESYQQRMLGPTVAVGWAAAGERKAEIGAEREQLYGTPETAADAIHAEIPKLHEQLIELNRQFNAAIAVDQPGIKRAILGVEEQITTNPSREASARYAGDIGIEQAQAGAQEALGSRSQFLGGRTPESHAAFMQASNVYEAMAARALARSTDPAANEQQQFEAYERYQTSESRALQAQVDDVSHPVGPGQLAATAEAEGTVQRLQYGYALPGGRQDAMIALRKTYSDQLVAVRASEADTRRTHAGQPDLDALMLPQIEHEQELMTSLAQSSYQVDRMFGQNLETLTVGGTSRTVRDMPSYAQSAAMIEKDFPTVAARNFGFTNAASGHAAMAGSDGYLAGGSSPEAAQPGNQTIQALAQVLSAATLKFEVNINGQRYTGPLKIVPQVTTNQSGFGTLVPGVSH